MKEETDAEEQAGDEKENANEAEEEEDSEEEGGAIKKAKTKGKSPGKAANKRKVGWGGCYAHYHYPLGVDVLRVARHTAEEHTLADYTIPPRSNFTRHYLLLTVASPTHASLRRHHLAPHRARRLRWTTSPT